MGSQWAGHDWETEKQQEHGHFEFILFEFEIVASFNINILPIFPHQEHSLNDNYVFHFKLIWTHITTDLFSMSLAMTPSWDNEILPCRKTLVFSADLLWENTLILL